ncbi:DNA cytosine methyltransferase [Arthrobacter sp. IK3]|uniref:DNA cytosine methyltransferase n=1 Tax=Arthrobacter sp. IK3 TaxID=3448169 RepID=UPI003EE1D3DD
MIDLFAGAGGLSEGLRESGFTSLYANEVVERYSETFRANHPDVLVDNRDVRQVDASQVREQLGLARGELSLIAGGPPCQGFSVNAPVRSKDDYRNHLFRDFLRFVDEFLPTAVLIENVPGLVSFENGATLAAIIQALEELGYNADVRILYAPLYGVPQTRWRTIILGFLDGDPRDAFPNPTHSAPMRVNFTSTFRGQNIVVMPAENDLKPHTSVRDAIGDLPALVNGESGDPVKEYASPAQNLYQQRLRSRSTGVMNHEAARLGQVNIERLQHIPPGGNWTNIPTELLPAGMKRARRSDHTKRYGRSLPDALSSTILTKCDPHWGAYFHYSQDRIFTVREAARIQSFPDHYLFKGSRIEQYEQVGNAVPPLLAAAVGASIRATIASSRLPLAV